MESDHTKQSNESGNIQQNHQSSPSPITKRQRLLLRPSATATIETQENGAITNNRYDNIFDNPNNQNHTKIIAPKINSYRDHSEAELSQWQQSEMEQCYYDNYINSEFNSIQLLINQHFDNVQNLNVEESAVSMAITEHGLNIVNLINDRQYVVAVRPVVAAIKSLDGETSTSNRAEVENNNSSVVQPLSEVILDNYDVMETAVAVAIERKGLFPL